MERHDVRENEIIEELVSSAERGVEVELTRDGRVVARVVAEPAPPLDTPAPESDWLADLRKLHDSLPPDFPRTGWLKTLREARDEEPF